MQHCIQQFLLPGSGHLSWCFHIKTRKFNVIWHPLDLSGLWSLLALNTSLLKPDPAHFSLQEAAGRAAQGMDPCWIALDEYTQHPGCATWHVCLASQTPPNSPPQSPSVNPHLHHLKTLDCSHQEWVFLMYNWFNNRGWDVCGGEQKQDTHLRGHGWNVAARGKTPWGPRRAGGWHGKEKTVDFFFG